MSYFEFEEKVLDKASLALATAIACLLVIVTGFLLGVGMRLAGL